MCIRDRVAPASSSQQAPPAKTRKAVVTKETKTAPATVENYGMKMKKDGTPDKRYKANPVSYTHLDVYKRQCEINPLKFFQIISELFLGNKKFLRFLMLDFFT